MHVAGVVVCYPDNPFRFEPLWGEQISPVHLEAIWFLSTLHEADLFANQPLTNP